MGFAVRQVSQGTGALVQTEGCSLCYTEVTGASPRGGPGRGTPLKSTREGLPGTPAVLLALALPSPFLPGRLAQPQGAREVSIPDLTAGRAVRKLPDPGSEQSLSAQPGGQGPWPICRMRVHDLLLLCPAFPVGSVATGTPEPGPRSPWATGWGREHWAGGPSSPHPPGSALHCGAASLAHQ